MDRDTATAPEALAAARDICRALGAGTGSSLATGALGIALACQHVGTASSDQEIIDLGRKHLIEAAARWAAQSGPDLGLFNGYSGFAWVVADFAATDARYLGSLERLSGRLAQAIVDEIPARPTAVSYRQRDVIDGWAGQLACVLRLRQAAVPEPVRLLLDQAADKLIRLLAFPAETGGDPVAATFVPTPASGGADWYRRLYPHGHYPLGMAHGAAGVLAALAAALLDGIDPPGLASAVSRLARWLLDYQGCDTARSWGSALSADPVTAQPVPDSRFRVPSGWCKGTSGVACALVSAAAACDEPDLGSSAGQALRTSEASAEGIAVRDLGLCHGSSGRALIYLRAARLLKDRALRRESDRQLAEVSSGRSGWPDSDTFLSGRAGVAYALAQSVAPARMSGHRLLLLA